MEQAHPLPITYRDLRRYPDDGKRRELIDGEVIVSPSPAVDHQTVVIRLAVALHAFVTTNDLGFVFPAPIDVYFTPRDVVQPDLVYVSYANRAIVRRLNVHGAPDLCIEVISPGSRRRDTVRKRALYARFGVPEYWIVDPAGKTIDMLCLPDAPVPLRKPADYAVGPASRVLPDLVVDHDALFAPAFPP